MQLPPGITSCQRSFGTILYPPRMGGVGYEMWSEAYEPVPRGLIYNYMRHSGLICQGEDLIPTHHTMLFTINFPSILRVGIQFILVKIHEFLIIHFS
jgi:hypothetical protein